MAINHSGFFNKYWTNHHVILRYVNLNMINYMLGHHMTSPHHTRPSPWKKRRSISQFCSLVAKRIRMICCQFSIPVFTLLEKIQWVLSFSWYGVIHKGRHHFRGGRGWLIKDVWGREGGRGLEDEDVAILKNEVNTRWEIFSKLCGLLRKHHENLSVLFLFCFKWWGEGG